MEEIKKVKFPSFEDLKNVTSPERTYYNDLERIAGEICEKLKKSLQDNLEAHNFTFIGKILQLDDSGLSEADRTTSVNEASKKLTEGCVEKAKEELAKLVDFTEASTHGLDPVKTEESVMKYVAMRLEQDVSAAISGAQKTLRDSRANCEHALEAKITEEVQKLADQFGRKLMDNDFKDLTAALGITTIGRVITKQADLISKANDRISTVAKREADTLQPVMLDTIKKSGILDYCEKGGMSATAAASALESKLNKKLEQALESKMNEAFGDYRSHRVDTFEQRANTWNIVKKVSSILSVTIPIAATLWFQNGAEIFWGPVGVVALTTSFLFCRWRENRWRAQQI